MLGDSPGVRLAVEVRRGRRIRAAKEGIARSSWDASQMEVDFVTGLSRQQAQSPLVGTVSTSAAGSHRRDSSRCSLCLQHLVNSR